MSYLKQLFSLEGKTAVIIGGTGELCGTMALAMAQAGAEIALVGRDQEKANARIKQIKDTGGKSYFIAADVSTREGLENTLAAVIEKSQKCEILINGAGINAATPFLDIPDDEYDRIRQHFALLLHIDAVKKRNDPRIAHEQGGVEGFR